MTLRPGRRLHIENTYLFTRLEDEATGAKIFTNRIVRSRWNWQFDRKFSVRAILQYDETEAEPALSSLETTKNYNGDLLLTYLVNPWTAIYLGYNGNYQNLDLVDMGSGNEIVRTDDEFLNDSRQLFFKISWLFGI